MRLLVQAGTLLIVARLFGPPLFGAYAGLVALAVLLGTLATFGTHLVLLAEASRHERRRLRVLPYAVPVTLLAGGVLAVTYVVLVSLFFDHALLPLHWVAVIALTELIVQPLLSFPAVQLQAQHRVAFSQCLRAVSLLLRMLAAIGIWLSGIPEPLPLFLLASLAAAIIGLVLGSVCVPRAWPAVRHWRLPSVAELQRSAAFATLNVTAAGPSELDKALAVRLLPLGMAGVFAGAARVVGALTLPVTAMVHAALPSLFRAAQERAGISRSMLLALYSCASGYGLLISISLWFAAPWVAWLFGPEYVEIVIAVRWLCMAIPALCLRLASGALLMAMGQPWARVGFEATGLVVLVISAVAFVPERGLSGMATAVIAAEWSMCLVGILLVRRDTLRAKLGPVFG